MSPTFICIPSFNANSSVCYGIWGPDILIATHSTEIITEAETDDIVLINKQRPSAKRIKHPAQLEEVFSVLGSNLNPILTQLAKTRRVVFVEGQDFQLLSKFAHKLGNTVVGNRSDFAVVAVSGFNPERARNLKIGMETTLGGKILGAAILDKDYRSEKERMRIERQCTSFCDLIRIHHCKELENFLLVPDAIDRSVERKVLDQARRAGKAPQSFTPFASNFLEAFCNEKKSCVQVQYLAMRRKFEKNAGSSIDDATFNEEVLNEFEKLWSSAVSRLLVVPGKEALGAINNHVQELYGVNITATSIVDIMKLEEIPLEMKSLIEALGLFASTPYVDAP